VSNQGMIKGNMEIDSLFLQLIQPYPLPDSMRVEKKDLAAIKSLGLRHGVFPLIYGRLRQYLKDFPGRNDIEEFLRESENLYLSGIARSVKQEAAGNRVISLLARNEIPSLVIKGGQIANDIYQDPNCRVSYDIDILIRRDDALKADRLLAASGYIGETGTPLLYCMSRFHHATYHHPEHDFVIEMHWNFGVPYFFLLSSEEIWRDGIFADQVRMRLSPEMTVIMLLIHHHSHAFRELRILTDILWALYRYQESINWYQLALKLRETGLVKTSLISLHQISMLWEDIPDKMSSSRSLEKEIRRTGCKVSAILLAYFKMDIQNKRMNDIYRDKFAARFSLDKRSEMMLSFPRTIFPVPDAIRGLYRDRRNWTLPLNYMRFIAWRMKDWTGLGRNDKTPV